MYPEAVVRDADGRPDAIDYRILTAEIAGAVLTRGARAVEAAIADLAGER